MTNEDPMGICEDGSNVSRHFPDGGNRSSGIRANSFTLKNKKDVSMVEGKDVEITTHARVAVVGVGGAGNRVITDMYDALAPVHTIAINTDKNALHLDTRADQKIYICKEVLKGEGTRGDVTLGKRCAEIHRQEIKDALKGYDYVFVVAGLGGGTGSGAAPVIIDIAESLKCSVFAIMIKPFSFFEMNRVPVASESLSKIRTVCSSVTVIENDRLLEVVPDTTTEVAFRIVNRSIMDFILDSMKQIDIETMNVIGNRSDKDNDVVTDVDAIPITTLMKA